MSGDFSPKPFEYDVPPEWYQTLTAIDIALSLYFLHDESTRKTLMSQLLETANFLETSANQIAANPAIQGNYIYDGQYYESDSEIADLTNGLTFLEFFSSNNLTKLYAAGGNKAIIEKINLACKAVKEAAIMHLGSVPLKINFSNQ